MKPILSINELTTLCTACPSDWEGRDHLSRQVYIRFRWGYLSVTVTNEDSECESIYGKQVSDPLDGIMDRDTMREHTEGVIEWRDHPVHFRS